MAKLAFLSSSSVVKVHRLSLGRARGRAVRMPERVTVCDVPVPKARQLSVRALVPLRPRRCVDPSGGDEETRTPDFLLAKEALYQLSYVP